MTHEEERSPTFNPYRAGQSYIEDSEEFEYNDAPFYAKSGRIGRLRYLAYSFMMGLIIYAIGGVIGFFGMGFLSSTDDTAGGFGVLMFILLLPILAALIYAQIAPAIRRFNDLNHTGWLSLLMLIPYLNFLVWLYLVFAPGNEGVNKYGAPAYPPSFRVKLVALILPAIFIIGILAAISLPAYQDYVERAQSTQSS